MIGNRSRNVGDGLDKTVDARTGSDLRAVNFRKPPKWPRWNACLPTPVPRAGYPRLHVIHII